MRCRISRLGLAIALGALSVLPVLRPSVARAAGGNTWYVSTSGTDPATCPPASNTLFLPLHTIAYALSCAAGDAAPASNPDIIQIAANTSSIPAYAGGFTISQNVNLVGSGSAATSISGGGTVITVAAGSTVTISGVTITGGSATNGGGIYSSGTLTVSSSTISGNTASYAAGGVYNNNGSLTMINSTISGNGFPAGGTATYGGGIFNLNGTATVTGSTITGNQSGTGNGGGVDNTGTLTIQTSTINNNSSCAGGGIANVGGTLTVVGSSVNGNTSCADGGGINNYTSPGYPVGSVTVSSSTISGNQATGSGSVGGGLTGVNLTVVNSTITGNSAIKGGGIQGNGTVINSTITGNSASVGGGGYYLTSGAPLALSNTILARNTSTSGGPDCDGVSPQLTDGAGGHNLLGIGDATTCAGLSAGNGDQVGTATSPIDPKLGPLAYNSGPNGTMALLAGSPAIGGGSATTCQSTGAAGVNNRDQRGNYRQSAARGSCDIGAFDTAVQQPVTWYVSPAGASGVRCQDSSSANPLPTIPAALDCAAAGDTIKLAATGTGAYAGGFIIGKSVTVVGAGTTTTFVNGGGPSVTILPGNTVTISSLAIGFGSTSGIDNSGRLTVANAAVDFISGGYGVLNRSGSVTVMSSLINSNSSSKANAGGIFVGGGTASVFNSTITQNSSGNVGGGLLTARGATLTVTNSTITGNQAANTGGGIYNVDTGTITLRNSTISGNSAPSAGGIWNDPQGSVVLSNTLLAGNTLSGAGGTGPDCSGVLADGPGGHNLVGNSSGCDTSRLSTGDQVGTNAAPIDPRLDQLADNGGPTQTLALLPGSPAIGGGDPSTCQTGGVNDQDQRGAPRNSAARATCDIGAYDTARQPVTWYVSLSGTDPGTCPTTPNTSGTPFQTIPFAISCAFRGDTISLAATGNSAYVNSLCLCKVLTLTGAGAASTTLKATGSSVIRDIRGEPVTVSGVTLTGASGGYGGIENEGTLTLTNSTISGNSAPSGGGGATNYGVLTMSNSTIINNSGVYGGAVQNYGTLTVTNNSTISNNSSSYLAGGIYNDGTLSQTTVTNSTITGNTVSGANGGGGIYNDHGTLTVSNSTVSGNTVSAANGDGGGIYNSSGSVAIASSTVSGNQATGSNSQGGGIRNAGGTLSVTGSTVKGNSASFGGGVSNNPGTATISSSTINGNSSSVNGGGIDNTGTVTVSDSTITSNTANTGGGATNYGTLMVVSSTVSGNNASSAGGIYIPSGKVASLGNTILAQNTAGFGPDCWGALSDLPGGHGSNLLGSATNCTGLTNGPNGDLVGVASPGLGSLASNGGSTQTISLLPGSPALKGGDTSTCGSTGAAGVNNLDQRGMTRPTFCSIGAYDAGTWSVNGTTGSDPPAGSCPVSSTYSTLAAVLTCAGDSDTVNVAAGSYAGGVSVSRNIGIAGAGARITTITGGGPVITVPAGVTAAISGVTVMGGNGASGSGISTQGNLTVTTSNITGNSTGGNGGGILAQCSALPCGSLTVTGTTISGNSSAMGGGIYNSGIATTVTNSTISGNQAGSGGGGGIATSTTNVGSLILTNTTLSSNSTTGSGGGLWIRFGSTPTLTNTILAGNTASTSGPDCVGTVSDGAAAVGHNILGNNGACSGISNESNGDQVGTPGSPLDPKLGNLAGNGGPTQTMALLPGSPAIDNGDDSTCSGGQVNKVDQRGTARPFSAHCDVGALESVGLPVPLSVGWNLLDLPVHDPSLTSLSGLLSALNSQLGAGSISMGATYGNGRLSEYVPGYSADVPLSSANGIFILSSTSGTWNGLKTVSGSTFYTTGQTISLHPGWNLVGAPFPYQGLKTSTIAGQIDPACGAPPCNVQEIAIYSGGSYQTFVPGGTDLSVPASSGMWIQVNNTTNWTPR